MGTYGRMLRERGELTHSNLVEVRLSSLILCNAALSHFDVYASAVMKSESQSVSALNPAVFRFTRPRPTHDKSTR